MELTPGESAILGALNRHTDSIDKRFSRIDDQFDEINDWQNQHDLQHAKENAPARLSVAEGHIQHHGEEIGTLRQEKTVEIEVQSNTVKKVIGYGGSVAAVLWLLTNWEKFKVLCGVTPKH